MCVWKTVTIGVDTVFFFMARRLASPPAGLFAVSGRGRDAASIPRAVCVVSRL